jgi:hypothetical protein
VRETSVYVQRRTGFINEWDRVARIGERHASAAFPLLRGRLMGRAVDAPGG